MKGRRDFIKSAGVLGMMTFLSPNIVSAGDVQTINKGKRSLRLAHITDVHLLDQNNARTLFARVLSEINSMKDKPDFIINTGDTVFDENGQTFETVNDRWKAWSAVASSNKLDMFSALGNHDVWYGPDEKLDAEYKKDKRYGKQWAIDILKLPHRYYSFNARGWKFIALDSITWNDGYSIDDEQFVWLERELANNSMPVIIFNHVPILSIGALLYYTKRKPLPEVKFPRGDMHDDHERLKDLFRRMGKVKVCLSGHVHYIDAIEYLGVKYFCNGAVSGNWWGDPISLDEFPPVYAIVDLYDDGSVTQQLVYYNTSLG